MTDPRAARFAVLLSLVGCSDYGFNAKVEPSPGDEVEDSGAPQPEPKEGAPALQLSPEAVALGPSCTGTDTAEITLSNVGDAVLTVTELSVTGPGWALDGPPALPLTLDPSSAVGLRLIGAPGVGELLVLSDDPERPEQRLPLSLEADLPPTVRWVSPTDGDVLAIGATGGLVAEVSDDHTPPGDLRVSWSSDVDGPLSGGSVDAAGIASQPWDAARQSAGAHQLTVEVTDGCEQTATDRLGICQNAGYISDTLDLGTWTFNGTAGWDSVNGWVELTAPFNNQAGTAFQTGATVSSDNVSIEFAFYGSGGTGADGLSLTALDTTRMTSFVGDTGGGIGYGGLPGWSVEVDTFYNAEHNDPTSLDHLSLHLDGNVNGPVTWATLPEMEDGAWHQMSVQVSGLHFTVSIDGVTYIDQDVPGLGTFPAYVGFTAATGSVTNYHLIDALLVEEFVCETP